MSFKYYFENGYLDPRNARYLREPVKPKRVNGKYIGISKVDPYIKIFWKFQNLGNSGVLAASNLQDVCEITNRGGYEFEDFLAFCKLNGYITQMSIKSIIQKFANCVKISGIGNKISFESPYYKRFIDDEDLFYVFIFDVDCKYHIGQLFIKFYDFLAKS